MRLLLALWVAGPALAQPAFTVASVKPTEFLADKRPIVTLHPGRLSLTGLTLQALLARAYGVREYQVRGPEWIVSERYTVAATMPEDTPEPASRQMLQTLLKERFQLRLQRGTSNVAAYALVVGKSGPKLKAKTPDAAGRTLPQFCHLLTGLLDRPVVDQTGLSGVYDVTLDFAPYPALGSSMSKLAAEISYGGREPGGPSIFTAVQEQLGLRLEARKMPMETVVVESALRVPTEN